MFRTPPRETCPPDVAVPVAPPYPDVPLAVQMFEDKLKNEIDPDTAALAKAIYIGMPLVDDVAAGVPAPILLAPDTYPVVVGVPPVPS
jgi:hypothetical protein